MDVIILCSLPVLIFVAWYFSGPTAADRATNPADATCGCHRVLHNCTWAANCRMRQRLEGDGK